MTLVMSQYTHYLRLEQSRSDCSPGRTTLVRLRGFTPLEISRSERLSPRLRRSGSLTGFTLIEVTVSLFVISVILVASTALLHGVPANELTRDQTVALSIARNELEALRAGGYAALPASGLFSDPSLASLASSTGSITVAAYDSRTKRVDVSVTWREKDATSHTIVLTTLVAEAGGLR